MCPRIRVDFCYVIMNVENQNKNISKIENNKKKKETNKMLVYLCDVKYFVYLKNF